MLVALQFPYVDVRKFIAEETKRLPVPTWPFPQADSQFIRSCGAVRKRVDKGSADWAGEEFFCTAKRLVKFVGPIPPRNGERASFFDQAVPLKSSGASVRPYCAFRRFRVSVPATVRLDLGIGYEHWRGWKGPIGGDDIYSLIAHVLTVQVKVSLSAQSATPEREGLFEWAATKVPTAYLSATTKRPAPADIPRSWWVTARAPLMLIEYETDRDFTGPPANAQLIDSASREHICLSYLRIRTDGKHSTEVGAWLLGTDEHADPDYVRRLRNQLLRLHAEQQTIAAVFQLIAAEKIPVGKDDSGQRIQEFLRNSIEFLQRKERFGITQSDILLTAQRYDAIVEPGETTSLIAALGQIRPNLLRNVTRFAKTMEVRAGDTYNIAKLTYIQEAQVTKQTQTITNSRIEGGVNQVAAKKIEDSFNTVRNASDNTELKQHLEQIHKTVEEILSKLPPEQQEELAEDVKVLTQQATSGKPMRKWYDVSAKGLIEAANTIGELANPIKVAVAAITALLF
jgi:hypothetical protein